MTLIAFYFALISLASSLFFNQVEAWHGPVRSFEASLKEIDDVDGWRLADEQRKPIEAAAPNLFSVLVGLFVAALTALAFLVPIPSQPPFDPLLFLRLPLLFVVVLFWGLGLARLIDGHRRLVLGTSVNKGNKKRQGRGYDAPALPALGGLQNT